MRAYKLDNPVWHSVCETHKEYALTYNSTKFYHPDNCPFGGFKKNNKISIEADKYSSLIDNFFIVGESNLEFKK